ncbi:MAG: hypothetical protein HYT98_00195 [Candidatus Sungbacteria bacterium]|nr:hypothetical protein [Candidatus Sungbacteria bacterium]
MGRIVLVMVLVFSVAGLSGCTKKDKSATVERPKIGSAERPQAYLEPATERVPEQRTPVLTAEEKEREAAAKRMADINEIRTLIQVLRGERDFNTPVSTEPAWVTEMKTGISPSVSACRAYDRYQNGSMVIGAMERINPPITSIEIPETESGVRTLVANAGLAAARELLAALQKPYPVMTCGRGERSFNTNDPLVVAKNIAEVLMEIGKEPSDIGLKGGRLRKETLLAVKARLTTIRKMIENGEASKSDGGGEFNYLASDAVKNWHFTPGEIGLTKEETAQIR